MRTDLPAISRTASQSCISSPSCPIRGFALRGLGLAPASLWHIHRSRLGPDPTRGCSYVRWCRVALKTALGAPRQQL